MLRNYLRRGIIDHLRPERAQKGQSIIIITFAFLGLLAMMGLALDLGLVYIERIRVGRTADAAALAAVVELPFEEEAMRRAIEYIELNGYSPETTDILVRGCIDTGAEWNNVGEPTADDPDGIYDATDLLEGQYSPTGNVTGYLYRPAFPGPARARFVIDTLAYQTVDDQTTSGDNCFVDGATSLAGTAGKLRVTGEVLVNMSFMQFFGFDDVPVADEAVGQNVTNLDVVVVFDVSGSMNFETTCFDCWEAYPENDPLNRDEVIANPWPTNGFNNPMPLQTTSAITPNAGMALCTANPVAIEDTEGSQYLVHEAELYSENGPPESWYFKKRQIGQGFWVIQRANRGASAAGGDTRGAYMRPHPLTVYSQSDIAQNPTQQGASYNEECFTPAGGLSGACWATRAAALGEATPPSIPPWLEYDFTPPWNGETHIWIRAQGAHGYADEWYGVSPRTADTGGQQVPDYRKTLWWQLGPADGSAWSEVFGGDFNNLDQSGNEARPETGRWRWVKLGSIGTDQGVQQTLRIYQGSAGFNLDKIIFTTFPGGSANTAIETDGDVLGTTIGNNDAADEFIDQLGLNGDRGPVATDGSATREACNVCNPIFGGKVDGIVNKEDCSCKKNPADAAFIGDYPAGGSGLACTLVQTTTNQLAESDLFHDIDPLRSAKEAVKNFAVRLDPKFDQIGFVTFSTNVLNGTTGTNPPIPQRSKMQCLRWSATNDDINGIRGCYLTNPISYTQVIQAIEVQRNSGSTNIGEGILEGLEELGVDGGGDNDYEDSDCSTARDDGHVCDRRGAAQRVLVLMTDGSPNQSGGCSGDAVNDLPWQGLEGEDDNDYNCPIYYAREAYKANVTVYTIGIGAGANPDLLWAIATGQDKTGNGHIYFGDGKARGGKYYNAAKPSDLDAIFTDILSNIFVRIVG